MVRIMSDLILDYDENTMWDLKAHNPQLQRFEAHKNLPKLSFPELEDLELDGWREKTPADIKTKPEENTNNLADGLIEGGSWKGQGLGASTTQPPHIDNPPPNPQNKENHNQQGLG